jgi:transposase
MAYNFLACDRDQAFLLPPDVRDWLPADHLAWFILDVVDQLDLGPFLAAYRADGHGRAAYQPRMLLAGLLVQSLKLCAGAGMVRVGLIALDGTKVEANAAAAANRTYAHLEAQVAELLQQAAATDQAEDREHGAARGDELPRALAGRAGRLARLQHAKACWRPRPPPASSATNSGSPTWPPPPGPVANSPEPTSDHAGAMRPPTQQRRSTPPTPPAALCAATAGPCRATTLRRPPPPDRSWSPPSSPNRPMTSSSWPPC